MIPDLIGLKAKLITGGIAVAIFVAMFAFQEFRISERDASIKTKDGEILKLSSDLAVANSNVATLTAGIDRQNAAIESLKEQKAALDAKVRKQALEARRMRENSLSTEGTGAGSMNEFFERLYQ